MMRKILLWAKKEGFVEIFFLGLLFFGFGWKVTDYYYQHKIKALEKNLEVLEGYLIEKNKKVSEYEIKIKALEKRILRLNNNIELIPIGEEGFWEQFAIPIEKEK